MLDHLNLNFNLLGLISISLVQVVVFVKFTALPSFNFFPFEVHPFLVKVCMISR